MPRAARVCGEPGCSEIVIGSSKCEHHQAKPWSTGNAGRGRGGWAWTRTRREILARDDHSCTLCGLHDQTGRMLEVDHDDEGSLRTLCISCHKQRTQAQSVAARRIQGYPLRGA